MIKTIVNFLKADLRMPQLMFWDWLFPLIVIGLLGMFINDKQFLTELFPKLIIVMIMQSVIFSIPYRIAQYKENKIIDFIKEKGSILKFLYAFFLSRIIIILIQVVLLFILSYSVLNIEYNANYFMIVIMSFITIIVFLLIGCFAGLLVKTQNAALGLAQAVYFFLIAISGIFYPLAQSPEVIVILSKISPITYLLSGWEYALNLCNTFPIDEIIPILVITVVLVLLLIYILKTKEIGEHEHENITQINKL